jgi:hypothetical protein
MDTIPKDSQVRRLLNFTQSMLFLNALVWLIFSVLGFMRFASGSDGWRLVLSGLMLANAAVMFWLGMKIVGAQTRIFFFAILYMALNVVLSITDQFGWYDLGVLLLNLIILGSLFVTRRRLTQAKAERA